MLTYKPKIFFVQALNSDLSVCMATIRYRGPITAIAKNEQLLEEKKTRTKFQRYISKAEGLVSVYTEIQIDTQISDDSCCVLQASWQI